jgi:hypothetical protein
VVRKDLLELVRGLRAALVAFGAEEWMARATELTAGSAKAALDAVAALEAHPEMSEFADLVAGRRASSRLLGC